MRELLKKLSEFKDLSKEEIKQALEDITEGRATDAQIGAFIVATKMKGETPEEIEGAASFFRERAKKVELEDKENLVDTCGTGGDMSETFNVSTTVAFVLAGAGIKVAKHGNRSVSSKSGSADLLEHLGAKIDLGPEQVKRMIEETGIGFMFAPMFHPAMKRVIGPRREVGIRSIFNLVGPLSNPADAKRQLLGVFADSLVDKVAFALRGMGIKRAFVVHGKDGMDEVSVSAPTRIAELRGEEVLLYEFHPEEIGFKTYPVEYIRVSSVEESAKMVLSVLKGEVSPAYYMVLLNSMFGIIVSGLAEDRRDALEMAKESIHSGRAYQKLQLFVELSKKL
ncbi:MAG: anthranilate phosphoribosyltransferase [Aquificaceae bacterium]|nr:anthranilate phosphoribosyltransferase [Aquificaceae bacterium]MCS7196868.1 anthranilate phosphoribosyltransferase [Aquificaceae bacterium]MCX7989753.1 anthranilate phosphoribosyltransferase [Aquificaceae bacterium]MDW8032961.1 anthranilate phosphoribosyltransferase [Aquificaceae bacterium]